MNLVLQKGAVPRPPLAAASSAGNWASVPTNAKVPLIIIYLYKILIVATTDTSIKEADTSESSLPAPTS